MMNTIGDQLKSAIAARYPLIFVRTPEEDRVIAALDPVLNACIPGGSTSVWTSVSGWAPANDEDSRDPATAVQATCRDPHPGFYVMKDLTPFMSDSYVIRSLRDAYYALSKLGNTFLVILSPVIAIPEELSREVFVMDVPLPGAEEHMAAARKIETNHGGSGIPEDAYSQVALSMRGLSINEAGHVLRGALSEHTVSKDELLERIFDEKQKALRRLGVLAYVRDRVDMANVGGLEILQDWIQKRKDLFTQEAIDQGLPVPKGVLFMGVSGCGKSLCAKAVARLWNVPLFRLDMNMVFSGLYGNPHAAFQRALAGIESVAPAVLWIDEIENGLGMTTSTHTTEQTLTFSTFLTWMQERPPLIFVAATANKIECLPAEVIRKGRFDEVFFCDLPSDKEREVIIRIHLRLNGIDTTEVEPEKLLYITRGWTGAEIEQAIIAARIEAHHEDRTPGLEDVKSHMRTMVPISTTMSEQIRAIREWSRYRARRASKAPPKSMIPE